MTREKMQLRLQEYQQQLSQLASKLVSQHPEGAKLFGKIEILAEILKDPKEGSVVAEQG